MLTKIILSLASLILVASCTHKKTQADSERSPAGDVFVGEVNVNKTNLIKVRTTRWNFFKSNERFFQVPPRTDFSALLTKLTEDLEARTSKEIPLHTDVNPMKVSFVGVQPFPVETESFVHWNPLGGDGFSRRYNLITLGDGPTKKTYFFYINRFYGGDRIPILEFSPLSQSNEKSVFKMTVTPTGYTEEMGGAMCTGEVEQNNEGAVAISYMNCTNMIDDER